MLTNHSIFSNISPDQQRNLKPSLSNQNAYSASPSQLTLPSDLQSNAGLPNPYQHTNYYVPNPHDPSGFAFPPPSGYRPQHIQTQHQHQPQQHLQQQHSPLNPRKRRASELGDLPGSSSSNASAFGHPTGLMTDLDQTLGGPSQQPLSSPVIPKKGRTNTPWTPAEEQRLKTLRDAGSSWSEIAKTFPLRTEGSVKKHWYKVGRPWWSGYAVVERDGLAADKSCSQDMHYAEFAEDEVSNFVRLPLCFIVRTDLADSSYRVRRCYKLSKITRTTSGRLSGRKWASQPRYVHTPNSTSLALFVD